MDLIDHRSIPRRRVPTWILQGAAVCLGVLILSVFAHAERLPIRSYTVADGLPHNSINRIVRDSRGFLWFCTADGLSLFDGYRFTNYGIADGLPHQNVTDFLETRDGEYWLATNGGLARFNPRGVSGNDTNPMFTVLMPTGDDRRARVLTRIVQGQDGTIWAGSWDGLVRVSRVDGRDQLARVDLNGSDEPAMAIEALLEDRFGTLWIGASNGLYRRWPDGRVARYDQRTGLPGEFVHDLLEDRQGQLWVGTREDGFFNLVTAADETPPVVGRSYRATNGFTDWVFDLHETSAGRFFVATNHGLFELSSAPGTGPDRPQLHTTRNGFVYHEIKNVTEDGAGNVWLGTVNGAMKITRGGFRTFDSQDGVHLVNALFESTAGELHAFGYVPIERTRQASDQDVSSADVENYAPRIGRFDDQSFTWLLPELHGRIPSWSPRPFVLQAQGGEWWIGTNNGLVLFRRVRRFAELANAQPAAVYSTRHGLATPVVYSIYEDSRGDLWISTIAHPNGVNGLARWDRTSRTVRDLAETPGLPSLREYLPVSFREDRAGHVWVGFSPGGLARYANDRFEVFTEEDGLPPGTVNDLLVNGAGRLWIATARGGIARLDDPTALRPTFITYSTAKGLSSDRVTTVTEDEQGLIYVGTGRGLDQITPVTGRIKHFTTADGLAPGEVMSALRDRNGALWFSTRRGVSRAVPEAEWPSQPPPIWISGLRAAGERRNLSALGEAVVALPDLRADGNQMQIDFVSVSFAPGETLRYQYKLEGTPTDWSAPTEQRTVHLAGLAPGDYTFLVRAINSDQVASLTPARVRFTVLAPVWQRTWFLASCVAASALLLYALYRHRLSRLLELERIRTRIASDLHDDIGAALSRIAVLSEVAGQEVGDGAPVKSRLSVIASASRDVLDGMSDIVWATNPQRDQVRDLAQRMRRFASDMFSARPIAFSFRAPQGERRLSVGADVRRQVFLIFKEAVNNVVRHSSCSKADVELRVEGGRLALTISDNGQGFDTSLVGEGNGLRSMHARARMIGGDFHVDSHEGGGTIVGLTVDRHATVSEREPRLQRPKS